MIVPLDEDRPKWPAALEATLLEAFGLADASAYDVDRLSIPQQAEFIDAIDDQLAQAKARFEQLTESLIQMRDSMRANVAAAIRASGGTELPHENLKVTLSGKVDYVKDIPGLLKLKGEVPESEFRKMVYVSGVDLKRTNPLVLEKALALGVVPELAADAGVINRFITRIGEGSELGERLRKCCARSEGPKQLKIERKTKAVRG